MRKFWVLLLGVALLLTGQGACARENDDYIRGQSFYEDKSNALTYEEAKSVAFTPYTGLLAGGYSKSAYWIRLDVHASTQELVLKIRPSFLNEITLYDPVSSRSPRTTGNWYPVAAADIKTNSLNFLLSPSPENRTVYLRIKSKSSYIVYTEVLPLTDFERAERSDNVIYTGYIMLTLILAVWMSILWLMHRDWVVGAFAIQQFVAVLHTFSRVGFARTFFDGYVNDVFISEISNLILVVYALVVITVNKLLLQEYGLKRLARYIFNAMIIFSLGLNALYLSGHHQTALSINALLVLVMMTWFWICALWGTDASKALESSQGVQLKVLRLYYTINTLVWIVTLLPFLGVLSTGPITLHSLFFYNITSSLVFFVLLQYRARWMLRNEAARASTLEAEATQERRRREEQAMLMAMLSHEIKTPLSILKLVMDEKVAGSDLEGHANRAVSNINFIVNRCLQLGKLDAKAIQTNRTSFDAREFFEETLKDCQGMDRFKISIPTGLQLSADREILRVVMSNLLENAIKYGAHDRPVFVDVVSLSKHGGSGVQMTVRNEVGSLGVPDAEQVFKKYYRNTQATKVAGSGLGLFLVRELVEVMGGRVTYATEEQEVAFSVWIPN